MRMPAFPCPARLRLRAVVAMLAAAALLAPSSARAEAVQSANVRAELLSEQETVRPGEPFTVGIALSPSPGWHTYWENPGDSGLPTRVQWKLPPGFRAGELEWPHPVRMGIPPFVTFGYEGDALLLARIDAPAGLAAGSSVDLAAAVRWLSCREDACVPGKADLTLRIRVENSAPLRDSRWTALFDAARAELPRRLDGWTATAAEDGAKLRIEVAAPPGNRPSTTGIQVFPLVAGLVDASAEAVVRGSDRGFTIEVARGKAPAPLPAVTGLVLVAEGGWDADGQVPALRVDAKRSGTATTGASGAPAESPAQVATTATGDTATNARPGANEPPSPAASSSAAPAAPAFRDDDAPPTLWAAILLALAGGLILNLMPCVFPVLSLKVLGFLHVAHHEAARVRRHGYAFAAGVLLSFWVLAGLLLALRAAGDALGWGFQLQQPLFVAAMAALLLAMALNLFGVFEVGASVTGAVGRFDSQSGYRGSFLSGALATLLATPCSAPFMGSAVGYALVQPPLVAIAVFTALGAGMAAPYVVLACAPALLARLPRPGAWMERFREAMAFPLLATVAWLVWVFGQQTGNDGVLALLMALLTAAAGAWVGGRFGAAEGRLPARVLSLLLLAASAWMMVGASQATPPASREGGVRSKGAVEWQPWDPDAIAGLRAAGRVVFVDFTADWCLSCKANEKVALSGEGFAAALRESGAVAMRADWTSANPRITEALSAFGRSGVPLYVVYPRDAARPPRVLPQLLTPALVAEALKDAAS